MDYKFNRIKIPAQEASNSQKTIPWFKSYNTHIPIKILFQEIKYYNQGFEQLIRDYMLQDTIPNPKPSIIINHKLSQETTKLPKPQLTHTAIHLKMPITNQ